MAYRDLVRAHGATHLWTLDEPSGTSAADSIGTATGTITGGVTQNIASPVIGGGKAMTFNGTTGKIVTAATILPVAFTIEAWVNLSSAVGNYYPVVSTRDATPAHQQLLCGTFGTTVIVFTDNGTPGQISGPVISLGSWHHLVWAFTASSVAIYIDGQFINTYALTLVAPSANIVNIGFDRDSFFFPGSLDEVAIYNVALSAAQIRAHYVAATTTLDAYANAVLLHSPSNYWRLNETTGVVASDLVGAAPGTISGGVTLGAASGVVGGGTSMAFDGTDTAKVNAGNIVIGAALSWEVWARTTTASGFRSAINVGAASNYIATNAQWLVGALIGGAQQTLDPGIVAFDSQWHHLVATYNGSTFALYIDGVVRASVSVTGAVASGGPMLIGNYVGAGSGWLGTLDEVAIYPSALTQAQIRSHYAAGIGLDAYGTRVLTDGASNYWRLNETSGTLAADLAGGAAGTISGGVTLAQPSGVTGGGTSMAFDGTTGKIVTVASVSIPLAVTCEAWIKNYGSTGGQKAIVHQGNNSPLFCVNGLLLAIYDNANSLALSAGVLPNDSGWHHVVYVLNGSNFTTYIDGAMAGSTAAVRTVLESAPTNIAWSLDNGTFWPGSLDEVAIYPSALTPAQIAAHYREGAGLARDTYGLKVIADGASNFWRLDETTGTLARDVIGGANGTISGGVTLAQPGQVGKAMTFNGTTGKIVTTAVLLPVVVTFEAWVKFTSAAQISVLSNRDAGGLTFAGFSAGKLFFYNGTGFGGPTLANDNRWHHVVYVIAGAVSAGYVDGRLETSTALTPVSAETLAATIAADSGVFFPGLIDEVAIYPLALTPTQIAAHAAAGKAGWPGVPWWTDFDEDDMNNPYNLYEPITPSDGADLKRGLTLGIWVGGAGDVAAVTQSGVPTVFAAVPAGAWLPLAARRINATGTTATGLVGLYRV